MIKRSRTVCVSRFDAWLRETLGDFILRSIDIVEAVGFAVIVCSLSLCAYLLFF
jgi:hypothetical protein